MPAVKSDNKKSSDATRPGIDRKIFFCMENEKRIILAFQSA